MYHIPLQNTDKVETGQTGLVLNLQPLCTSIMVPNVTLEKSYHPPLTAWRLHHPNNTRPKYRTVNCIVRNPIAPLLFHAAHTVIFRHSFDLLSAASLIITFKLRHQEHLHMQGRGWQSCCSGVGQPSSSSFGHLMLPGSEMQHLEPKPSCPVSPRGSSAPWVWFIPCKLLSGGCRHNWSCCTPSLSSSERFLKLGGINPGLGDYHRHPFSMRLICSALSAGLRWYLLKEELPLSRTVSHYLFPSPELKA